MKGCSFCVKWKEGVRRHWLECMVLGDTLEQVQKKDPCRPTFLPLWPPLVEPNLPSWYWVGNSIEWKDIVAISLAFQIPIITRLSGHPSSHYMQMKCLKVLLLLSFFGCVTSTLFTWLKNETLGDVIGREVHEHTNILQASTGGPNLYRIKWVFCFIFSQFEPLKFIEFSTL